MKPQTLLTFTKKLAEMYRKISEDTTRGLEQAIQNLSLMDIEDHTDTEMPLLGVVQQEISSFVLGTEELDQSIGVEDQAGKIPTIDCAFEETLQNLGLDSPVGFNPSGLTQLEALQLVIKIDFQVDSKAADWRSIQDGLRQHIEQPEVRSQLVQFQNYFVDALSVLRRIPAGKGGPVDVMKRASIRKAGGHVLEVHTVKDGLREGEESIRSGTCFL